MRMKGFIIASQLVFGFLQGWESSEISLIMATSQFLLQLFFFIVASTFGY